MPEGQLHDSSAESSLSGEVRVETPDARRAQLNGLSTRQSLAVLGVTSGVVVGYEVLVTRLLSVVTWYGMAFFVLSIAMLGLTAGSLRAIQAQRAGLPLRDWIAGQSVQLAGAMVFALVVTLVVPMPADPSLTLQLSVLLVAAANTLPMILGGGIVARIMAESSVPIGITYGVDLSAAAVGALCPLALLGPFDVVDALLVLAVLPAIASAAVQPAGKRRRALTLAGVLGMFALLNNHSYHGVQIRFSKDHFVDPSADPQFAGWNALSTVSATAFTNQDKRQVLWGPSSTTPNGEQRTAYAAIDGQAGTRVHAYQRIEELEVLKYDVTNAVHWIRPGGPACVIGAGGGRDVESALLFGHNSVFAVEINPLMIEMLERFRAESPILNDPRVKIYVGDGRSVITARAPRCRALQVSLVDTWAATGAGAFAHTEATLYTQEAWSLLLQRVEPDGVLTFSRWYSPSQTSETARLLALAVASLLERNVARPEDQIALIAWTPEKQLNGTGGIATVLVSPAPLSAADVATLRTRAAELHFDVLAAPGMPATDKVLRRVLETRQIRALGAAGVSAFLDTSPPTDNRPFFFQLLLPSGWLNPELLLGAIAGGGVIYGNVLSTVQMIVTFVAVIFLALFVLGPPLLRARRTGAALPDGGSGVYFAMLGAGFMLVELALVQRLHVVLGHPTYALVVVLASLLVCTGIGSALSPRLVKSRKATSFAALAAALLLAALPHLVIEPLARATLSAEMSVRIIWSALVTGLVGLVLGTLFPSGIRFVDRDRGLPIALGINGATSVVGSILSILVSVIWGIAASFAVAAMFYVIAAIYGPYRWRAPG
jgi:hypothetical protein